MKKITFDISLRVLSPWNNTANIFSFCCEYPNEKISGLFADKHYYILYMCSWWIYKVKAIFSSDL